jgi:excisionase family DNA binding protein
MEQTANHFRCDKNTVREWIKKGWIIAERIGYREVKINSKEIHKMEERLANRRMKINTGLES